MRYIICYDITEDRIRRRVVNYLESFAYRMQYSVFCCDRSTREFEKMRKELTSLTAASERCALLIAPLCENCASRMWQTGTWMEEERLCVVA
ncbi:CRISPR-associated endoribonuclease Cas2 [Selenomonas sp. oral taxon 137 str. F0430]|uniref:CRISPR-associated endonuclease Cas2 n=1 Tax=Selenomonas sp. oral taxon 137 TaxID=712531 RepID=UPI0001EB244F|nr:CRISPR-associated endonuclease Cas2 [Selenomonas sp. oral taxon 137]EFR42027.1 CRISPR-associated endoribonuclease Cas2 [Selenomonas sp. oral taxon 137 str. F0430]